MNQVSPGGWGDSVSRSGENYVSAVRLQGFAGARSLVDRIDGCFRDPL